jgi:hypothetical protein
VIRFRIRAPRLLLAAAAMTVPACHTWETQRQFPRDAAARNESATVRVHLKGGPIAEVERPTVVGDSLIGVIRDSNLRFSVPVDSVVAVEVSHFSWLRTIGLVPSAFILVFLIGTGGNF